MSDEDRELIGGILTRSVYMLVSGQGTLRMRLRSVKRYFEKRAARLRGVVMSNDGDGDGIEHNFASLWESLGNVDSMSNDELAHLAREFLEQTLTISVCCGYASGQHSAMSKILADRTDN